MKFMITKEKLLPVVNTYSIYSTKRVFPILMNVLIECDEFGTIKFTATNLNLTSVITIKGCIFKKAGAVLVDGKKFCKIIKYFSNSLISFEKGDIDGLLHISDNENNYSLLSFDHLNFPLIKELGNNLTPLISGYNIINNLFTKTISAVSNYSNRPIFTGVLLKFKENRITSFSTDGKIMKEYIYEHQARTPSFAYGSEEMKYIIPKDIIKQYLKISKKYKNESFLYIVDNTCFIKIGNILLFSNIIDERFPDYEQVYPKFDNESISIFLDRKLFISKIKQLNEIGDNYSNYKISLSISEDKKYILLKSLNKNFGEFKTKQEAVLNVNNFISQNNNSTICSLSGKMLLNIISEFKEKEVILFIQNGKVPIMIKGFNPIDNYKTLLMPLRLP